MTGSRRRRVALAVPQGLTFLEHVLREVTEYARRGGGCWTFTRLPEALGTSIDWLRHWSGDGAFALIVDPADVRIARRLPFPVVNLASHLPDPGVPSVVVDHALIGASAARHLLDRQFRRFGYYGAAGLWYSRLRGDAFRQAVTEAGGTCAVLEAQRNNTSGGSGGSGGGSASRAWRDQQRELRAWLLEMRPPVGVMASTDLRAAMVLEAAREAGLRVPEDVAVVGVDNDPVSEFCDPPLTSVSRNNRGVGREAAGLLDRLIAGRTPPDGPVFVPPDGVVARRSSDTVAVEDADVASAVRFMRDQVHRRFGVEELLRVVPLSRRSLEYRFRASLGRSPYEYLTHVRVDAAKRRLLEPGRVKLAAVASACGFTDLRQFRRAFQALTGKTPAGYRRAHLGTAPAS